MKRREWWLLLGGQKYADTEEWHARVFRDFLSAKSYQGVWSRSKVVHVREVLPKKPRKK